VKPDWPLCRFGHGCTGVRVGPEGLCWNHLDEDALGLLVPGEDLDFRGTKVTGEKLDEIFGRLRDRADQRVKVGEVRCAGASFAEGASFKRVLFFGEAQFAGAVFGEGVSFADVEFHQVVDFVGAEFGASVPGETRAASFDRASFHGEARFKGAAFAGPATFLGTTFSRSVTFENVQFNTASLAVTCAEGHVSFRGARVAADLTLNLFGPSARLVLDKLRATGPVDVVVETASVHCQDADFDGRVRFLLSGGPWLWLTNTVFREPATVESRPSAVPTLAPVGYGRPVRVRSLRGVDAEHLTLANVDLKRCLIYGLRRPDELRLAGRSRFAPTPRGWQHPRWGCVPWRWTVRDALYEEHLWRRTSATATLGWETPSDPSADAGRTAADVRAELDVPNQADLAVLYRQLRQSVEDARNEPGAADLYYGEMEMRRLSTERRDERWLLTAYWLVSGYGLRASRSMLVLGALLLVTALALQRAGFPGPHTPGYLDCLLYAAGSVLSLDVTGHLPAALTDWGQLIRMVLRIGGPVLLGLGALAVRGRIKR